MSKLVKPTIGKSSKMAAKWPKLATGRPSKISPKGLKHGYAKSLEKSKLALAKTLKQEADEIMEIEHNKYLTTGEQDPAGKHLAEAKDRQDERMEVEYDNDCMDQDVKEPEEKEKYEEPEAVEDVEEEEDFDEIYFEEEEEEEEEGDDEDDEDEDEDEGNEDEDDDDDESKDDDDFEEDETDDEDEEEDEHNEKKKKKDDEGPKGGKDNNDQNEKKEQKSVKDGDANKAIARNDNVAKKNAFMYKVGKKAKFGRMNVEIEKRLADRVDKLCSKCFKVYCGRKRSAASRVYRLGCPHK